MLEWDRTQPWVLLRLQRDVSRVTVRFESAPPSVGELAALRRALPQFRDSPPAAIRALIGETRELFLGAMPTEEASRLAEVARATKLDIVVETRNVVGYAPFNRATRCVWLIENAEEAEAVTQSMLRAGVPVEDAESLRSITGVV